MRGEPVNKDRLTIWGVSESYLRWFSLSFSILYILGVVGLVLYERIHQQADPVETAVSLAKNSGPVGVSIALALLAIITIWEEIALLGSRIERVRAKLREEGRTEGLREGREEVYAQWREEYSSVPPPPGAVPRPARSSERERAERNRDE